MLEGISDKQINNLNDEIMISQLNEIQNNKDKPCYVNTIDMVSISFQSSQKSFTELMPNTIENLLQRTTENNDFSDSDLQKALDFIHASYTRFIRESTGLTANITLQIINFGEAFNFLKKIVLTQKKASWQQWALENIKFIAKRTRESYMQLAKVNDAKDYVILGKDILIRIVQAIDIKNNKSDKPIGDFLRKHNLKFNPSSEASYDEFTTQVELAIIMEKAENHGIKFDSSLVSKLMDIGYILKPSDIDEAVMLKEKFQIDPDTFLSTLLEKNGNKNIISHISHPMDKK
ncbi:MAG: hypothetical protein HQK78_01875 [Desulfobacterales bacterium]|nr:hypothetical protein [Desulfobacterales bacterium]